MKPAFLPLMIRLLIVAFSLICVVDATAADLAAQDKAVIDEMTVRSKELQRRIIATGDPLEKSRLQKSLVQLMEDTLPQLSENGRLPLLVGIRVMQPFQQASAAYTEMTTAFFDSAEGDFTTIKQRAEIAVRLATIDRLQAANLGLIRMLEGAEAEAAKVIKEQKVTPEVAQDFLAGFRKGRSRTSGAALAIRNLDTKVYTQLSAALTFLDANWGKWSAVTEDGFTWQDPALEREFAAIISEIERLAELQAKAEAELARRA